MKEMLKRFYLKKLTVTSATCDQFQGLQIGHYYYLFCNIKL